MLVLRRRIGETVIIDGGIKVTLLKVNGNSAKIGIDAPKDVRILRNELNDWSDLSFADTDEAKPQDNSIFSIA